MAFGGYSGTIQINQAGLCVCIHNQSIPSNSLNLAYNWNNKIGE